MYVCKWDICCRNFCNFSLVTKKCEKYVKIDPFSNERHFEIWFPKKKTIAFFWSKLYKLHKKDPTLHVTTTFSLKQGEKRTNSVPIPHPLSIEFGHCVQVSILNMWWVHFSNQVYRRWRLHTDHESDPSFGGMKRLLMSCVQTVSMSSRSASEEWNPYLFKGGQRSSFHDILTCAKQFRRVVIFPPKVVSFYFYTCKEPNFNAHHS